MRLAGKKILILATDGFEESELFGPRRILTDLGAKVLLASPSRMPIQATVSDDAGRTIRPDLTIAEVGAVEYDALILPGGVRNPDTLRMNEDAVTLIREFAAANRLVAAICHGPWLLVEADLLRGKTATSWPSIRTDLRNAGATVVDEPVVTDGTIITSRNPNDVAAFTAAIADYLVRGEG